MSKRTPAHRGQAPRTTPGPRQEHRPGAPPGAPPRTTAQDHRPGPPPRTRTTPLDSLIASRRGLKTSPRFCVGQDPGQLDTEPPHPHPEAPNPTGTPGTPPSHGAGWTRDRTGPAGTPRPDPRTVAGSPAPPHPDSYLTGLL